MSRSNVAFVTSLNVVNLHFRNMLFYKAAVFTGNIHPLKTLFLFLPFLNTPGTLLKI